MMRRVHIVQMKLNFSQIVASAEKGEPQAGQLWAHGTTRIGFKLVESSPLQPDVAQNLCVSALSVCFSFIVFCKFIDFKWEIQKSSGAV